MCHTTLCSGSMESSQCGCSCACSVFLSIDEEIRMLEHHKKLMQEQIESIERKITLLKSVK
jgi:hypothetical protein